tara:strand:+ start:4828 stop:5325 length:498 start_codon:yes stop_codon:yes gene_type:complete
MLEPWNKRSQIVAHLLNPAFSGLMLRRAVSGYETIKPIGMPFALTPLVLPLVLHPHTRKALPDIRTSFPTWLQEHRELLVDFPQRIKELLPYTRESIIFAIQRDALEIDGQCLLHDGRAKMKGKTTYPKMSSEIGECWRRSDFVGRWFADAGPVETIYGLLGITP